MPQTLAFEVEDVEQSRQVLKHALLVANVAAAKAKKKDEEFGLDTTEHERFDVAVKGFLKQLGWTAKGEAPRDPAQLDFTKDKSAEPIVPRVRIDCLGCRRLLAVPEGKDVDVACPDCGAVHQVSSSEGVLSRIRPRPVMPTHIYELWVQSKDKPLWKNQSKVRRMALNDWLNNPDHALWIESPELVARGERVANPEVVGSGNPLRVDCAALVGTECGGFDSFDTPGATVCGTCGQKYKVEVVEGQLNVTAWSVDDEAAARGE